MLFCRVTLGKSFLQFSAMKMAHAPPGHHSVIGRPSVNGLAYAEYVIYRGEQVSTQTRPKEPPPRIYPQLPLSIVLFVKNWIYFGRERNCGLERCIHQWDRCYLASMGSYADMTCCVLQAYPEYLITYQILKPESTAQAAAGAEQKS